MGHDVPMATFAQYLQLRLPYGNGWHPDHNMSPPSYGLVYKRYILRIRLLLAPYRINYITAGKQSYPPIELSSPPEMVDGL